MRERCVESLDEHDADVAGHPLIEHADQELSDRFGSTERR